MKKIKILNNYAGIGGNRKLWGNNHEITAVEKNPEIAEIYRKFFPNDKVIVADGHEYLLHHFQEFDFIWSSPPCPSHSRMNKVGIASGQFKPRYADMVLYQEIILLEEFFKGKFAVENVIPYYGKGEGLVIPGLPVQKYNRHLFWANFKIRSTLGQGNPPKEITMLSKNHAKKIKRARESGIHVERLPIPKVDYGFDLDLIPKKLREKCLLNCVDPQTGLDVFNWAYGVIQDNNKQQMNLNFK